MASLPRIVLSTNHGRNHRIAILQPVKDRLPPIDDHGFRPSPSIHPFTPLALDRH